MAKSKTRTEEPTASPPYKALALRQVGRSWQVVTLTVQGSVVIREELADATLFPIAVSNFKVAAARYFAEVAL